MNPMDTGFLAMYFLQIIQQYIKVPKCILRWPMSHKATALFHIHSTSKLVCKMLTSLNVLIQEPLSS